MATTMDPKDLTMTMDREEPACKALSLQDLCMIEIINGLECYPPELLARLPTRFRGQLLRNVPVLDLCRLENSPVAQGVELNSVWKDRYPPFLKRFERLPKLPEDSGVFVDWKLEYFNVVMDYILRSKPFLHVNYDEDYSYRYTIVDCLIAIRARQFLGLCESDQEPVKKGAVEVSWWHKHQTPLIFYEGDKVTAKRHIELRDSTGQDSLRLLDILAFTCHFRPKTFNVDRSVIDEWGKPLLQDKYTMRVLKVVLSEVEEFDVSIAYTSHNSDFSAISQIPTQITKAIFSNPNPKLKSVRLEFSYPGVMEKPISKYMKGYSPYLYALPSADHLSHITATYPFLTRLHIDGNLDKSSVITVAALIEQQSLLEHLEMPNFILEGLGELNTDITPVIEPIVVAVSRVFYKPRFRKLVMEQSHMHPSILLHILSGFLTSPCSHKQELLIDRFHITPTLRVRYEKPYITHPAPSCALKHKFLWPGKGTELKLIGELFPLVFKFPKVQMDTFLVGFYPKRGPNVLHLAAEHGNFFVTTFILVYITISDTLQDDITTILKIPTLHTFSVYPFNVQQLQIIANALQGQPNLLRLNLGGTNPKDSRAVLRDIFNRVFSFPHLSDFTLDLSHNSFSITDPECFLLQDCWLDTAQDRQLKELIIYCTVAEAQDVLYSIVKDVAVTVSFVDDWSSFEIGF